MNRSGYRIAFSNNRKPHRRRHYETFITDLTGFFLGGVKFYASILVALETVVGVIFRFFHDLLISCVFPRACLVLSVLPCERNFHVVTFVITLVVAAVSKLV